MKIFGREPALWIAFLGGLLQLLSVLFLHWSGDTQGAVTAVITALFGLWTAFHVSTDKVLPAILGLAQAGFSLFLAFGGHVPADTQGVVMSFITVAVGMFVRTQVVAPIPQAQALGNRHEVQP